MERVVITGTGLVSPLGNDVSTFWNAMLQGKSGISRIDSWDTSHMKTHMAGVVRDFDADGRFGRKEARRMDRFCHFAMAAAEDAIQNAGLALDQVDKERMGVYVGSGIGGISTLMEQGELLRTRGASRISPLLVPMMISNMAASMISIHTGAQGPTLSPVTACSIGNTAIGEAFRLIRSGGADVIIAGGAEAAITEISMASFGNATALSTWDGDPALASRPFDAGREGFVMAEGAGILVLESLTHARKRGARIYAEVTGYGASSDAYHMVASHPEGRGAYQAMKLALQEAGVEPEQVDVISAHATSTQVGDRSEMVAIKRLFGEDAYRIPVTANKSMLGHMFGAAGGAEAIALVQMIQEGRIPPTINQEVRDPECDLDVVPNVAREKDINIAISNSFGFGGHNAVIVLQKFKQ
ncbi:3-oxoacyl-[acyl-carrier-protein] synthase 2 [Paenibacillus sp. J23TS9]|uniref:beta-ketoacyl-ACP synthase II n=1 Tax=Paenibacillus sp. J23TS9 TaxID=2807193 RepID=UPI001B182471|nr:beta-ketoacyl-ACP synthase II [Paenibacillus sp. J23TS9]GIP27469.1 3-oxoacyl-[acyl-carrier-protein] synthase 2 [Paenibacillus sp. J23TS9]